MKFIDRNMLTLVILLLGMSSIVFAETCMTLKPVDEFSMKKLAGDWYLGGVEIKNSKDYEKYSDMECAIFTFFVDNEETTSHNWTLNLITRGKPTVLYGQYTLPDSNKGKLNLYFAPRDVTYNFFALCTDYENYLVAYGCVDVTPGDKSEYLNMFVRDPKKYDEIVANPEIQKCYAEMLSKKIEDSLMKVPFHNCPSIH